MTTFVGDNTLKKNYTKFTKHGFICKICGKRGNLNDIYKDRKKLFFFFLPQALENSFKFLNPSYMQLLLIFNSELFYFHALCFSWITPGNFSDNEIYERK